MLPSSLSSHYYYNLSLFAYWKHFRIFWNRNTTMEVKTRKGFIHIFLRFLTAIKLIPSREPDLSDDIGLGVWIFLILANVALFYYMAFDFIMTTLNGAKSINDIYSCVVNFVLYPIQNIFVLVSFRNLIKKYPDFVEGQSDVSLRGQSCSIVHFVHP